MDLPSFPDRQRHAKESGKNGNGKKLMKGFKMEMKFNIKDVILYLVVGVIVLLAMSSFVGGQVGLEKRPISQILADAKDGKIEKITVTDNNLEVKYRDGKVVESQKDPNQDLNRTLFSKDELGLDPKKVALVNRDDVTKGLLFNLLGSLLPIVVIFGLIFWMYRRQGGGGIFSFGQSPAKLYTKDQPKITFADVAGVDEAKKELEEVVDFLKNPKKYAAVGARTPKGVLLLGPSGVGKTLLAKAVAGEAGVPFFSMAGSEFMEMLVGVGASRARDLFSQAKKAKPAIIFIDEIDAIGRTRSMGLVGGHDEREQTLNQILIEMDGFEPNEAITVIGASVVGETPVMVRRKGKTEVLPIGRVVDSYYPDESISGEVKVEDLEALGFERKVPGRDATAGRLYFQSSAFKKVRSVFRHKVSEIYLIRYLGGEVKATGNHSVFVRTQQGLVTKPVSELSKGDLLVDLPLKVRQKEGHEYRAHRFSENFDLTLPVFDKELDETWQKNYFYATENVAKLSQSAVALELGVSQGTISHWQRGVGTPRAISRNYTKHQVPETIKVTQELMRLFGYYVAEGYACDEIDFCFAEDEQDLILDLTELFEEAFGLLPDHVRHVTPGAVNIVYSSSPVADFLVRHLGKGAKNKHVPDFLFSAPRDYFLEFLRGIYLGDGSTSKEGKGGITSVSERLILELNWLCRMHGIKSYMGGFTTKEGRRIKGGKPLPASQAYRLGFGKAHNPFSFAKVIKQDSTKRAVVQLVTRLPFDEFVYDFCGVDNEAFFGGNSPVLLHNTNRGDLLDPALLRPGRFDRRVVLDLPDKEGRLAILEVHKKNKPFDSDVDWEKVAKRTVGFSGADLENMLNEAAILAARNNRAKISAADIEEAATKVKLGPQKKRLQSDLDKKMTAYHEAGHAIVTHELPYMDPVHRISIVSRGMSLGHTLIPPAADRLHETKSHILEQIASMLGGRAAEQLVFSEMTTGASSDIEAATGLAREMVMEFGMSVLGPINLGAETRSYAGRTYSEQQKLSEEMMGKIDEQVKRIIDEGYKLAFSILSKNRKLLDKVAARLLEVETMDDEEFARLMGHPKVGLPAPKLT